MNRSSGSSRKNSHSSSSSYTSTESDDDGSGSQKTKKKKNKRRRIKQDVKKEGYILKRKSKRFFGSSQWQKRYIVLDNEIATFYVNENKKSAKKSIDMSTVS